MRPIWGHNAIFWPFREFRTVPSTVPSCTVKTILNSEMTVWHRHLRRPLSDRILTDRTVTPSLHSPAYICQWMPMYAHCCICPPLRGEGQANLYINVKHKYANECQCMPQHTLRLPLLQGKGHRQNASPCTRLGSMWWSVHWGKDSNLDAAH
jgi:hypothetical protein